MKRQSSVAELKKELAIREKTASGISTQIDKLEASIVRLKKQRDEITGEKSFMTNAGRRKVKAKAQDKVKRVKGKSGLKESLIKVFTRAGKPLHINDILKGLKAVGHKTNAKDIKKQLGVRLYTCKEFIKTAPGTFTLNAMGAKVSKKASKTMSKATGKKIK
jgi:hypothetical protein